MSLVQTPFLAVLCFDQLHWLWGSCWSSGDVAVHPHPGHQFRRSDFGSGSKAQGCVCYLWFMVDGRRKKHVWTAELNSQGISKIMLWVPVNSLVLLLSGPNHSTLGLCLFPSLLAAHLMMARLGSSCLVPIFKSLYILTCVTYTHVQYSSCWSTQPCAKVKVTNAEKNKQIERGARWAKVKVSVWEYRATDSILVLHHRPSLSGWRRLYISFVLPANLPCGDTFTVWRHSFTQTISFQNCI